MYINNIWQLFKECDMKIGKKCRWVKWEGNIGVGEMGKKCKGG